MLLFWWIWNQQAEPTLERKSLFRWRESKNLEAVQVQTSLVMSWHGFTGEGKGLLLPLHVPFKHNSCAPSDLNKKTPQFTQDFSAMMIPRWKAWENNQCYEAERGEKGTERQQTVATSSFICPCQLWERENLVPFSEICQCLGKVRE